MIKSIKENYGRDEINFALDMVSLQKTDESDFERNVKDKQNLENRLKENLK